MIEVSQGLRFTVRAILLAVLIIATARDVGAQRRTTIALELEAGPAWQTRNDVQIPNAPDGTRFSLVDIAGKGPVPAGRLYVTWYISRKHSLQALLAPFQINKRGSAENPVDFAGESYVANSPLDATYKFNSWRIGYRYQYVDRERLNLAVGFTAKLRDAKVELAQGSTTSKDTDLGFVPLLHLGANWKATSKLSLDLHADGLAGGPGRAFDVALKLAYTLDPNWSFRAGYRTVEGGADVESVYNFAWIHYAVVSVVYRS